MTDIDKIKKAAKGKDDAYPEGLKIDTGENVYFVNFKRIHATQGFTDDRMFITVPMWYDREIRDKKTGDLLYTKKELGNFIVMSSHEIVKPSDIYFQKKGIVADLPETVLDERWSMGSIQEFYKGKKTVDPRDVFSKLKGIWQHFMDLSGNPGSYTALPLVNTLSYCVWLFPYAPYIKYEGEKGSSKSKACEIHEYIDFNAFPGVDQTPAVIYRTLQDTRGTLIIDEAENYDKIKNKSEYEQAREAIVNAGFKANGKVPRLEGNNGHFRKVDYHVFGIKIIGGIHGVSETIRDRSYQIMLFKTLNKEVSKTTPRPNDPMFQEARDMLYLLVLNHWKEIRDIAENEDIENRLGLIGREWDKAKPLLVIASFYARHDKDHAKEIMDDIWLFLKDQKNREITLTLDTFDEVVINQVEQTIIYEAKQGGLELTEDRNITVPLVDVSFNIAELEGKRGTRGYDPRSYNKSIRKKIERLGLGADFRHGVHNGTVFTTSLDMVKNARKRFNIALPTSKNEGVINQINLITLINQINQINRGLMRVNENDSEKNLITLGLTSENVDSLKGQVNELIKLIDMKGVKNDAKIQENPEESDVKTENQKNVKDLNHENEQSGKPENIDFSVNPKKSIFEFVKWKAPKSPYGSLKVKQIYDMILEPSMTMKAIYDICEKLYDIGAFLKTPAGAYKVNPDYLPEGDLA